MLTGSAGRALGVVDLSTGKNVYTEVAAHEAPISVMTTHLDSMLITGDDEGCVKLWDLRKRVACFEWREHEDYIADFAVHPNENTVLSAGGDGYLSALQLRKGTLEARSDNMEDELLSVTLLKYGKKAVVGTQEGILNIWSWGYWGDVSDRFPGHPGSISTMAFIDESTICTGASDGLIRVCSIQPNKLLGIVGSHEEFPIEKIKLSRDKKFLGSASHDNTLKFWNIEYLFEDQDNEEEDSDKEDMETEEMETEKVPPPTKKNKKQRGKEENFFQDLL